MNRRGVGGVVAILGTLLAMSLLGASAELYINGQELIWTESPVYEGDSVLVPLLECAPYLGLEVKVSEEEPAFVLRGSGFRARFDVASFAALDGIAFASLDWLVAWAEGRVHHIGEAFHVETSKAALTELDALAQVLTVRLDRYAPHEVEWTSDSSLTVRIFHSELHVEPRRIVLGEADIRSVQVSELDSVVQLVIEVEPGTELSTDSAESAGFYSLSFAVAPTWSSRSSIEIDEGIRVVEHAQETLRADYAYIETWRDRFRLTPAIPWLAYGEKDELETILRAESAQAALGLPCYDPDDDPSLLLVDGIPYAIPDRPNRFLAIDLFGRWSVQEAVATVNLKHAGLRIPVDAVNRPLGYGEVVLYAPGYQGNIARGVPGSFLAIKIREDRVVSVYQGPFVPSDPTAVLVVASGEAKARLSLIKLSDALAIECLFGAEDTQSCVHAFSCGPEILRDSVWVLDAADLSQLEGVTGGTLLVNDWQGGAYLMQWTLDPTTNTATDVALDALLSFLPTAIKDAVLLDSCASGPMAYSSSIGAFRLGAADPIPLALCLVPLTP